MRTRLLLLSWMWVLGLMVGSNFAVQSFAQEDLPETDPTQRPESEPDESVSLQTISAFGMSSFTRNRWGAMRLVVSNPTDEDKEILVSSYLVGFETDQFGKRVWVPAKSRIQTWFPFYARVDEPKPQMDPSQMSTDRPSDDLDAIASVGQAPPAPIMPEVNFDRPLDLKAWVTDVTGGQEVPVGDTSNLIQRDATVNIALKEPRTAIFSDGKLYYGASRNLTFADTPRDMSVEATVGMRTTSRKTRRVQLLVPREIPADERVLSSFDQIVVAGDGFSLESNLTAALRGWVQQGGSLWVMVDSVDIQWLQSLLGDTASVELLDRTTLENVTWKHGWNPALAEVTFDYEDPVPFRRLVVDGPRVDWTIDGWPAIFSMPMGRGKILFSAIDARGMVKRAKQSDFAVTPPGQPGHSSTQATLYTSDFALHSFLSPSFDEQFQPPVEPRVDHEVINAYVNSQIGYQIPSIGLVLGILGAFCVLLAGTGVVVTRASRPEAMLVVGPVLSIATMLVLSLIGMTNLAKVPETVAELQLITGVDGVSTVDVAGHGMVFVSSGEPRTIEGTGIGPTRLIRPGSSAEVRRQIWIDNDRYQLENVMPPVGQSELLSPHAAELLSPVEIEATFDERGVIGHWKWDGVTQPEDSIAVFENLMMPVRFEADQKFRIEADARLAAGQFLSSGTLNDEQQRRQVFYREMFADPANWDVFQPTIYFWSDLQGDSVNYPGIENRRGAALMNCVIHWNRPAANTPVRIPQGFLKTRTSADINGELATSLYAWRTGEWISSKGSSKVYLQLEVPKSLLPLRLEQAEVSFDLRAEGRKVIVTAVTEKGEVELVSGDSPQGKLNATVSDPASLSINARGCWVLAIETVDLPWPDMRPAWQIEDFKVDLKGVANVADSQAAAPAVD